MGALIANAMRVRLARSGAAVLALGLLTFALMFLLAACGGSKVATSNSPAATSTTPIPQVIRVGYPEQVKTLNLTTTSDILPQMIVHMLGGTLTRLNADGTASTTGLAQTMTASNDGKTYTFVLRPNLKFSDGTSLTATDVKATFDAARGNKANVNSGDYLAWSSVTAPDASTVVINLKAPQPGLPQILAATENTIFPGKDAGKSSFYSNPISDGPYKLASISPDGRAVTLVANQLYWGLQPLVPKFEFLTVADENTEILELRGNQIDVAGSLSPAIMGQVSGGGLSAEVRSMFGAYYVWMSDRSGPLSNVNVRKAISYAINRKQLNDVVWRGTNKVLGGLFPSTMAGHVENIPTTQDIAKAKALLASTPYAQGATLQLMVRTAHPVEAQYSTIIQQNLALIGIKTQLTFVDSSVATSRASSGDFQMQVNWLGLPLNTPDQYMAYSVLSTGGINCLFSGYHSAQMDKAVTEASQSTGSVRDAALATVNSLFAQDLPYLPLTDYATIIGWGPSIKNFVTYGPSGWFDVKSK